MRSSTHLHVVEFGRAACLSGQVAEEVDAAMYIGVLLQVIAVHCIQHLAAETTCISVCSKPAAGSDVLQTEAEGQGIEAQEGQG